MNINGKDGPTLKQIFTCDGCKYLGLSAFGSYGKKPFKCFHDKFIASYTTSFHLMTGEIGEDQITPESCPFLLKKIRNEKLKELNEQNF